MRKTFTLYLLQVALLVAAPSILHAQCAPVLQWPRWVWQDLQYTDTTGYEGDLDYAIYGWEVEEPTISFEQYIQFEDVAVGGGILPNGTVGLTTPHTELENSGCSNKTDYCDICMDGAVFYYAVVALDFSQLYTQYQNYYNEGYVYLTYDDVITQAMSHEFGHVLRESDLGKTFNQVNCSATSIMGTVDVNLRCGNYLAQQCDGNTFAQAYSGWLFDTPTCEGLPYCNIGPPSGQTCQ